MLKPIAYTDRNGETHDCYQFLITETLAAALVGPDATDESIKLISDDFFSGRYPEHTKMIGPDGREVVVGETYYKYNQAARDLMDRVDNLPAYTVSLIAEDTYKNLLVSYGTEWYLRTWRKLMVQQNISPESLVAHANWILKNVASTKYTSVLSGDDIYRQNKLFLFSKARLLETVLNHPRFPQAEMVALCYNSDSLVRQTVAEHPKCPPEGKAVYALMKEKE